MGKYNLLVVGAMSEELAPTMKFLDEDTKFKKVNNSTTPVYEADGIRVTVLRTGVGLVEATRILTQHLCLMHSMCCKYDAILNIGAVAAINKEIPLYSVCYPTVVEEAGNPMSLGVGFAKHGTIMNLEGHKLPRLVKHLTGNFIYNNVDQIEEKYRDFDTFDMELYGLAKVCWCYGEPLYSLKIVSDTGDDFETDFLERVKVVGELLAKEMKRIIYNLK